VFRLEFGQNGQHIVEMYAGFTYKIAGLSVSWFEPDIPLHKDRSQLFEKEWCGQCLMHIIYPINRYCAIPKADLETQKGILRWTGKHAVFN